VSIRDFVLCKIVLNNANRSGVLANMTVAEFQRATVVDAHHMISVSDHKTASNHRPTKIVLNSGLFGWLSLFIVEMRPLVLEKEQPTVLLSSRGEPMTSGQISKAIQSVWIKSGLDNQKINCTLVRKHAVSAVHRPGLDCRSNLADLMGHRSTE
jgi:site-specific recombinase XerD